MNRSRFSIPLLAVVLTVFIPATLRAQSDTTAWSVSALDKILASVPPGQITAQVGDMVILVKNLRAWRNQLADTPGPRSAFDGVTPKWTGGNIYYTFDASVSPEKQRAFLDGAAEWAMMASLHFIPRTAEPNYMTVLENGSLSGGQSAVGMIGGQQFLQIGPDAWNRPTICHELGHTLGLIHEHQRSDRDAYVTVFTNNIESGELGNFIKLGDSQNIGAYDFFSVMHYNTNSFSIDPANLPTLYPLPAYVQFATIIGEQYDPVLSAADRAGMAATYGDAVPPVSSIVTNTADSGPGTLRGALYYALDHPGTTITFDIPTSDAGFSNGVFNILPTDGLPSLGDDTVLDATTEPTNSNPGGPEILLDGSQCLVPGTYANGLKFIGSNSVARGFIIIRFRGYGVLIDCTNATGNTLAACYVGVNSAGTAAVTNGVVPVQISNGANYNTIGGALANDRNVIGGSRYQGLVIRDAGTHHNTVSGNYIGLNAAGTAALPNTWSGIQIFGGAQSNRIGGLAPVSFNIISGNSYQGVAISDTNTTGNSVDGNYIGLGPDGANAIPNGWSGVEIFGGASSNSVGSAAPGIRNVISGNGNHGISISGAGTSGNVVQGNYIGLNAGGTAVVSNNWVGVGIFNGAQSNQIGVAGWGNVICGNGNQGVAISGNNTMGNIVAANFIGVLANGTNAAGNNSSGVGIFDGAQSNLVGGFTTTMRNVISGNKNQGVVIADPDTRGNVVAGNYIGVTSTGMAALGNAWAGVNFFNGPDGNTVGGTAPGAGNVISGNNFQGVLLQDAGTRNNSIQGNRIGLNAVGDAAIANGWSGVEIFNGPTANLIGGGPGARNFISGNGNYGVVISAGPAANLIQGNTIGLNGANGAAIPNTWAAVALFNGAVSNQIGGITAGNANLIANSSADGVQLFDTWTTNNTVRGNSIFNSSAIAIALYNNANHSAVAPELSSAATTTNTTVIGSLTSTSNTLFQIDFYTDAPPVGSAEGMAYLGARSVTTSVGGAVSFTNIFGIHLPAGRVVTATATDPAGNTSQFSTGVAVSSPSTINDAIPDAWREFYFGGNGMTTNAQSCATCDPDGDGMNNRAEFLAGTNPTNAASNLKLVALMPDGSGDAASFLSGSGVVYRLFGRDDPATGVWSLLSDQVIGSGDTLLVNDPASLVSPRRVYRAEVRW